MNSAASSSFGVVGLVSTGGASKKRKKAPVDDAGESDAEFVVGPASDDSDRSYKGSESDEEGEIVAPSEEEMRRVVSELATAAEEEDAVAAEAEGRAVATALPDEVSALRGGNLTPPRR